MGVTHEQLFRSTFLSLDNVATMLSYFPCYNSDEFGHTSPYRLRTVSNERTCHRPIGTIPCEK